MRLVDIKNVSRLPVTLQLSAREHGANPGLQGMVIHRSTVELDPVSGEKRTKQEARTCPPSVTIAPGETATALPESVLTIPQVKALTAKRGGRRPDLVVVANYLPPAAIEASDKKAGKKPRR